MNQYYWYSLLLQIETFSPGNTSGNNRIIKHKVPNYISTYKPKQLNVNTIYPYNN